MNRISLVLCFSTFFGFGFIGCESNVKKGGTSTISKTEKDPIKKTSDAEPEYITVQHCLIGFKGSLPDKKIPRSKDEAKELATKLLDQLKAGDRKSVV